MIDGPVTTAHGDQRVNTRTVRSVVAKLKVVFGPVSPRRFKGNPLDELIGTILSQSTTDVNSGRAYASLRERFPTWQDALAARTAAIAKAIRHGGLANSKARFIKNALSTIAEREGRLSLACLDSMSDEEALSYLTSIPGVGVKTASCVLLFALSRPAFPVDTHVYRVTRRLGWLPVNVPIEKAAEVLKRQIPDDTALALHLYLVWHGRRTCRSQGPQCETCAIRRHCRFARDAAFRRLLGKRPKAPPRTRRRASRS